MIAKFCEKVAETYDMYGLRITIIGVIIALALIFGALCVSGWLIMVILHWFEISLGFWWCFAIAFCYNFLRKQIENWVKGEK